MTEPLLKGFREPDPVLSALYAFFPFISMRKLLGSIAITCKPMLTGI